jgi:GNAT superfamily N-acetyltransferase
MTATNHTPGGGLSITVTDLSIADLADAVTVLSQGEGYSGTSALELLEPQRLRSRLLPFVGSKDHGAWKAMISDGPGTVGLLFFLHRNRFTDTFEPGTILGTLKPSLFPPSGELIEIFELWIAPRFRRLGIARMLKQRLEHYARGQNVAMLYTVTEADHEAVLALNRALGYVALYTGPMWDEVPRTALAKYLDRDHETATASS